MWYPGVLIWKIISYLLKWYFIVNAHTQTHVYKQTQNNNQRWNASMQYIKLSIQKLETLSSTWSSVSIISLI